MNETTEQILPVIRELGELCKTITWTESLDADGNPTTGEHTSPDHVIRAWNIAETSARFLHFMVILLKPKHILELGTSVGYSSLWLGLAAKTYDGHVDTVEYFDAKVAIAQEYIEKAKLGNTVTTHRQTILSFLEAAETPYNFVFMDADRANYMKYYEILKRKCAPNCLIIVDNAGNQQDRMQEFIDRCVHDVTVTTCFVPMDNGLLLIRFKLNNS